MAATAARVFILTGRAGQGKTNLVCDFVENFLWKHRIPCAYVSGRRLATIQSNDLCDTIQRLIFDGKTNSFADAAKLLSYHALVADKPFVLIIDGLNEHHRINEFAEQLERLIEAVVEYPGFRLFLTCRSEFFQQRFGKLTTGPFAAYTFLLEENERRHDEGFFREVVRAYFEFFGVRRQAVSVQAIKSLSIDILLLRFFCEAYGSRGKPADYRQPFIPDIYREHIFKIYLERKLGTADAFLRLTSGKIDPAAPKAEMRAVLERIIQHMLTTWTFSDAPSSVVPASLNDALFALLDEELILRRDLSSTSSIFATTETINFTFDEFRDFLVTQFLIHRTYVKDLAMFSQIVGQRT